MMLSESFADRWCREWDAFSAQFKADYEAFVEEEKKKLSGYAAQPGPDAGSIALPIRKLAR